MSIKITAEQRRVLIKFIIIHRSVDKFRFKGDSEAHLTQPSAEKRVKFKLRSSCPEFCPADF